MYMKIFLVMAGGSLGALTRYGVTLLAANLFGAKFPWGTLIVNLVGCFIIGFLFSIGERTNLVTPSIRLFFMTGFLGALTTFSTFALETVNSVNASVPLIATANLLANNVLGIALVFVGLWLGRLL